MQKPCKINILPGVQKKHFWRQKSPLTKKGGRSNHFGPTSSITAVRFALTHALDALELPWEVVAAPGRSGMKRLLCKMLVWLYCCLIRVVPMRKFLYLLLAVAVAHPALAASRVTVAELEQQLVRLKGKSDYAAAGALSRLELTERASSLRLARWETELPGKRCREALIGLADASAFLSLPEADVSSAPPPEIATQHEILARAIDQAKKMSSLLPNLYATRDTTHFEDTLPHFEMPQQVPTGRRGGVYLEPISNVTNYEPMHSTSRFSVIISVQDGNEVTETEKGKRTHERAPGLNTIGEFGPILDVVVGDSGRGTVNWDHWEQGPASVLAVFRFEVPQAESHFSVTFPSKNGMVSLLPAYHGEIAVDPSSGDIYRVTQVAEFDSPNDQVKAEDLVEYAPVALGDRSYICPVRGVAVIKLPTTPDRTSQNPDDPTMQTYLNDEAFTQFHLFHAETRILPE